MNAREAILQAVRRNQPAGEHPLPELPDFPSGSADVFAAFLKNLEAMGGRHAGDLTVLLHERFADARVVASAVPEYAGNRDLAAITCAADLADVDVAIVRAELGVAETGSVLLTDTALVANAVAYLAQHLVVLLDPAAIFENLQHAYRNPVFGRRHYAAFHTGPSATADIEGVLIHGAQGVRSLTVVLQPG